MTENHNTDARVSIIVPVYNNAAYLPLCVDSIVAQTYKNIEIILIDDGSTDNSGHICDVYAQKDARVKVLHQANAGVSDARNKGIMISSGQYLQFVDSDDYIDSNMTETMLNTIRLRQLDLVICGFKAINKQTGQKILLSYDCAKDKLDNQDLLDIFDDLYLQHYFNSPCNKLYIARILKDNHIKFDTGYDLGEDLLFNLEVFRNCQSFSVIPSTFYNVMDNNTGQRLTQKYRPDLYEIQKKIFSHVLAVYDEHPNYARQRDRLEQDYVRTVLINTVIYHMAEHLGIKDYKIYCEKARKVREDEIFKSKIGNLATGSMPEKLIVFLLKHNMYGLTLMVIKSRGLIHHQLAWTMNLMKKVRKKCGDIPGEPNEN